MLWTGIWHFIFIFYIKGPPVQLILLIDHTTLTCSCIFTYWKVSWIDLKLKLWTLTPHYKLTSWQEWRVCYILEVFLKQKYTRVICQDNGVVLCWNNSQIERSLNKFQIKSQQTRLSRGNCYQATTACTDLRSSWRDPSGPSYSASTFLLLCSSPWAGSPSLYRLWGS